MSRIGLKPIILPDGVNTVISGNKVTVSGKLGTLERTVSNDVSVKIENNIITLSRKGNAKETRAKHGLYRALINNMVIGVSEGFKKSLIVNGVGYKINKQGNKLVLALGLSHPVEFAEAEGITLTVVSPTEISVSGIDKEKVGAEAAKIKELKPVEPYHLYGIRYSDEVVIKKEGKTAGKK